MPRISREEMLMGMAQLAANRSSCPRAYVGAVLARRGRVLMTGYNGAPAGMPHCDHTCTCPGFPYAKGQLHTPGCPEIEVCTRAVHAEQNAIDCAARHGIALEESELFVTLSPCLRCAMSVINAGISRVTFAETYRDISGLDLLQSAGVELVTYRVE